jgi:hypothetical protein
MFSKQKKGGGKTTAPRWPKAAATTPPLASGQPQHPYSAARKAEGGPTLQF